MRVGFSEGGSVTGEVVVVVMVEVVGNQREPKRAERVIFRRMTK